MTELEDALERHAKEAMLYDSLPDAIVKCNLCAHGCVIAPGNYGVCQVRQNLDGHLRTTNYGRVVARHVDPMEKKPLYHFLPGTRTYSIAAPGCNFRCPWCQNEQISQVPRRSRAVFGEEVSPQEIVEAAESNACMSIAYTYTEPTIFFEYALDIARRANACCLHNVLVTNGFMSPHMLDEFHPYLDAANVDLKAFRDKTYRQHVGARLQPVLDNLQRMRELGFWIEVTTLVIPGLNDDPEELGDAAQFICERLGPQTPWHISRFHPAFKATDMTSTPMSTLRRTQEIGRDAGLRYVYLGNVPGESNTMCHECGALLFQRDEKRKTASFATMEGRCPQCRTPVAGVGMGGHR